MNDFTMKLGNFEEIPEKGSDNFATSIYECEYDGLLIARCNQNGRYPEHARVILEGLNGKKRSLDELTQHLDLTAAAKRIYEVFCGGKVDWARHALNDADDNLFNSADWAQAMSYARAALGTSVGETQP